MSKETFKKKARGLLEQTEALAKTGSWELNLQTHELVWSAGMYQILESEPGAFEVDQKMGIEIIHPDDRERVAKHMNRVIENDDEYHIQMRVVTPEGKIKHVISFGEYTRDGNNKPWKLTGIYRDISAEAEREKGLQKSNERLENIINSVNGIIWEADAHTFYIRYISSQVESILGYKQEQFKNDPELWHKYLHPDDKEKTFRNCREVAHAGGERYFEYRVLTPENRVVWIQDVVTAVKQNGEIRFLRGIMRDITQQKEAEGQYHDNIREHENRIEQSERRFKALVQEGSDLTGIIKTNGSYTYTSPSYTTILGYTGQELGKMNAYDLLHPDFREEIREQISNSKPGDNVTFNQYKFKHKTGEWRWMQSTCTNLTHDEVIAGFVVNSVDITNLVQTQISLREGNERFRLINKATNDAIYDWDIQQNLFYWGEGFKRIFGYDLENKAFSMADWAKLEHPSDRKKHSQNWHAFLKDKEQIRWNNSIRIRRANGTYAFIEEIGHLVRDHTGKPIRMIGAIRDISEQKKEEISRRIKQQISGYFSEDKSLSSALTCVSEYLAEYGEFSFCEMWLAGSSNPNLRKIADYAADPGGELFLKKTGHVNRMSKDSGLPGEIWQTRKSGIWDDIKNNNLFIRAEEAGEAGICSAFGIPLMHKNKVVGVMLLGSTSSLLNDNSKVDYLHPLSHFLGNEIIRKQQEEEMQQLFESAPEILGIASPDGYFIKVNPAFCRVLGYTEEELTSLPFSNFIHPDDSDKTLKEFKETVSGQRLASGFINRYRTSTGDYKWISWDSSEVINEEGSVFAFGRDVTDFVNLEQLLKNANKLARVGAWTLNPESGDIYYSEMSREILELDNMHDSGYDSGISLYPKEVQPLVEEVIFKCKTEGTPWDIELPIVTAKGNKRWVRNIGKGEFAEGTCVRIFGSVQDISSRKLAELQLEQALDDKNAILESIGESFFSLSRNWTVSYWNKSAESLTGVNRENIVGETLWDIFPGAISKKFRQEYLAAFETKKSSHFTEYFNLKGRNILLEISAYPSGENLGVFFRDITEKKYSEEKLRLSNERFEKVTEATNDAIWDFDVQANKLFWGAGFATLFGYKSITNPTFELLSSKIHPDDRSHFMAQVHKYMSDGKSTNWFEEYRFQKSDGTYALVIDRAVFIRDEVGTVIRVVGAMTDISYRKEHEESLKELNTELKRKASELAVSNRELEQFAYIASHDLQEPLRMVSSFLTLLKKRYGHLFDDKANQYIHFAVDGSIRMREIILDLLEYSRVGQHEDNISSIDIEEVIDEVCILQKRVIDNKQAEISRNNLPVIVSFRTPLTRIFQNLVENALKYSRPDMHPEISVNAEESETDWHFSVADNGIGIESEHQDKVFAIFQRLHSKNEYSGTGMGLAVVKKTLDALNGTIRVESEPGIGTTFYFSIPKISIPNQADSVRPGGGLNDL